MYISRLAICSFPAKRDACSSFHEMPIFHFMKLLTLWDDTFTHMRWGATHLLKGASSLTSKIYRLKKVDRKGYHPLISWNDFSIYPRLAICLIFWDDYFIHFTFDRWLLFLTLRDALPTRWLLFMSYITSDGKLYFYFSPTRWLLFVYWRYCIVFRDDLVRIISKLFTWNLDMK